jgi:predicted ATPase
MDVKTLVAKTLTLVCVRRSALEQIPIRTWAGAVEVNSLADRDMLWFESAREAVEAARDIVSRNSTKLSGGVSTGDTTTVEGIERLVAEASGAASLSEPGQVFVSLVTHEIIRTALGDQITFVKVGHRELATGIKSLLFLISEMEEVASGLGYDPIQTQRKGPIFVGRSEELMRLAQIYELSRAVGVFGESGIGKTALVRRFVNEFQGEPLHPEQASQVVWIDLDEVRRPSLMLHKIAPALEVNVVHESSLLRQIVKKIRDRELLIVLDGVDDVVESVGEFIEYVVEDCPNASFITTSRRRLKSNAVRSLNLKGLEFPAPFESVEASLRYDAIRLILNLAERGDVEVQLDTDTVHQLNAIANVVEGSPLAIQMAASRIGVLTPKQILSRLRDDPLAFLVDKELKLTPVHAALSAALSTLNPWSSLLFKRLWIFNGLFDSDSAEAICGDEVLPKEAILGGLKDLWEAHLIIRCQSNFTKRSFRLSQICREYSRSFSRSGERQALKSKLSQYLKAKEDRYWSYGLGSDAVAIEEFDRCYEDWRVLWVADVASRKSAARAMESIAKSHNFWIQKLQFAEGYSLLRSIVDSPHVAKLPKYVALLNAAAWFAMRMGDYETSKSLARRAYRPAFQSKDKADLAKVLNTASAIFADTNRFRSAVRCSRTALDLFKEVGHSSGARILESNLAGMYCELGQFELAETLLGGHAEHLNETGWHLVSYFGNWAHLEASRHCWPEAVKYLLQACDALRQYPYVDMQPSIHLTACMVALGEHRYVDLAGLIAATRALVDYHGISLSPKRQNDLKSFEALSSFEDFGLLERWNSDEPLSIVEKFLNNM